MKFMGGKQASADYCWDKITLDRDPKAIKEIVGLLLKSGSELAKEHFPPETDFNTQESRTEALYLLVEACWKEGFIACLAAFEEGAIQRVGDN